MSSGRRSAFGGIFGSLSGQVRARGFGVQVAPVILFDQRVAYQYLTQISTQIDQSVVEAGLSLQGTSIVAQPGQVGRELKINATLIYLGAQLQTFSDGEVPLVIQEIKPQILDVSAQADAARIERELAAALADAGLKVEGGH
jgi:vancomycin resistance protein YoaR